MYGEIVWAAVLAAVIAFNAPFALRLGAGNADIGLLTSLPALIAILVTIPAGSFLSRARGRMVRVLAWTLFANRIGYLMVAVLPWLPVANKGTTLVWLLVAFSTPAHFYEILLATSLRLGFSLSDECVPAGISADNWATTPASVRAVVLALQTRVGQLTQRVTELEERVQQTSQNSSRPPSTDPPSAPAVPDVAEAPTNQGFETPV